MRTILCIPVLVLLLAAAFPLSANAQFCEGNETRPCPEIGICKGAVRHCMNGVWGDCEGGVQPEPVEICNNGLDDDCNGLVDECVNSVWIVLIILGLLLFGVMGFLIKMGY